MHDSSYNNMKAISYVFPNKLISTNKYSNINTNYIDNLNTKNRDVFEYSNNKLKPMYNSISSPVYIEQAYNNPNIIKTPISKNCHNIGFQKNSNCLNSFPCLSTNSKKIENMNTGKNNNNKYVVKRVYKTPCYLHNRQVIVPNSYENIYSETATIPQNCEQSIYSKQFAKLNSYENIPNLNHQNNENEMKYIHEPFKKRVVKENIRGTTRKNKLNELIMVKDEQIKELEKNIEKEKSLDELDSTLENHKLKEKLLDQKIKYEEALKHLKKVEDEKRTLKTSLNARDKVLTKLENEINSVDHENDFLLKVKENTNLNDIHNVFKYLHSDANEIMKKNLKKTKGTKYLDEDELDKKNYRMFKSKMGEDIFSENEDISDNEKNVYKKKEKISKNNILDKNDVYLLKSTVVELEKEIHDLKEENKNVNFKYENTFKTLSELRKDTLEYMESIVSRDMRIAYMESMLQKCEKDLSKLREHFKNQQLIYGEKIDKLNSEIKILEQQSSHLQSMIQEKDAQIVLLKSEIVRTETLIKQYEERNKELQAELRLMCNNLENVIEASNKKDLFMNELEQQIRENEVHRQHAYLKEVAKNRKIHTDMKFKEILYDNSAKHKIDELHHLKKELYLNKIQIQKAKDAFEVLKRAPKAECLITDNIDCDYSTVNNLSEFKNEKNLENVTNEAKLTTDIYTEYKNMNHLPKKKNKTKSDIYV
ncbi:conserved Plasmodium protein, unknown function [Plasmodium gallinaceum]|uniref:Uncharacterized protein n=1 Tax=Plasmodium gallinaceum TaxID=5849 RepID=A0A1J1GZB7_PLAGA|nr:conserved Plasmodium protein, unknown function [Plasmodium gallinaceum]CRG97577.1 conserved Plasmodium protein, unknown function [Plasmodium gallinaceum]